MLPAGFTEQNCGRHTAMFTPTTNSAIRANTFVFTLRERKQEQPHLLSHPSNQLF
jgi:hypothetical protein